MNCGKNVLVFSDQAALIRPKMPIGANTFTPKISQLSQSFPSGLPLQKLDEGNIDNIMRNIEKIISNMAMGLSIAVFFKIVTT